MTVLTDQLLASFDDSIGPVNEARLLPPVLYTSPPSSASGAGSC